MDGSCKWCRDGTFDGQTVMMTNHGWVDIKYCPECGKRLVRRQEGERVELGHDNEEAS